MCIGERHVHIGERASERALAAGHAEVNGAVRASDFSAQKTLGVGVSLDTSFDALARSLRRTCEQVKSRVCSGAEAHTRYLLGDTRLSGCSEITERYNDAFINCNRLSGIMYTG